jgi:ribonuclease HII
MAENALSEPEEAVAALKTFGELLAGVDEAGRGPIAGPVVAAAVVLPPGAAIPGVDDSKKLTEAKREELYGMILETALSVATCVVDAETIDRINILAATHQAMIGAVEKLDVRPHLVLVDGLPVPGFPYPQLALVGGDARSLSIASASIVAKVTRDRIMREMEKAYPGYGFSRNKGYCTHEHKEALYRLGPCPIHRRSFEPVRSLVAGCSACSEQLSFWNLCNPDTAVK